MLAQSTKGLLLCRTEIVGNDAAGWVGGVPNQANITMPWRCQPVGGCTLQNVSSCPAPVLDATLVCPDASCNATHVSLCSSTASRFAGLFSNLWPAFSHNSIFQGYSQQRSQCMMEYERHVSQR